MLIVYILVGLIITVFLYLLFAPFYIEIDSVKGLFSLRFHYLANACMNIRESLYIRLKIAWWTHEFDLLDSSFYNQNKKSPLQRKKRDSGSFYVQSISLKKFRGIISSFRLKECRVLLDTGSAPVNGLLYPFFQWLSWYSGKTFIVNFRGETSVTLKIQNSIARICWAYLRSYIFKTKQQ